MFDNSATSSCDPSLCTLHDATCANTYASAYPTGNLAIGSVAPLQIVATTTVHAGWTETICVRCKNEDAAGVVLQTEDYQSYQVVQAANPCNTALSAKTGVTSPVNLNWQATPTTT